MASKTIALTLTAAILATCTATTWAARDPVGAARTVHRWALTARGAPVERPAWVQLQQSWWDCGPAALHNALALIGVEPPALDSLIRLTGATRRGTTLGALARAAEQLGLRSVLFTASPAEREPIALPVIAWFDRRHFVVLEARDERGRFVVIDPEVGRYRIRGGTLRRRWSGPGLHVSTAR